MPSSCLLSLSRRNSPVLPLGSFFLPRSTVSDPPSEASARRTGRVGARRVAILVAGRCHGRRRIDVDVDVAADKRAIASEGETIVLGARGD